MAKNTENKAFFSIITVTLNMLDGLKITEESLINQTCKDYEWIIIDGSSDDGTKDHLKTTNAKWTSEKDNGIYSAMNKGLEKPTGQYILFLNAGDQLAAPDTLQNIKNSAAKTPDFIYGDALEHDTYKPARNPNIAAGMFTHHQSMFYNRKALQDIRYNTDYKIAADYDLTARFLSDHTHILYCNFPICIFEEGGLSQTKATLGRREQFEIRKKLKLTSPIKNQIITTAQTILWQFRCWMPSLYWHLKSSGNMTRANTQTGTPPSHPESPP